MRCLALTTDNVMPATNNAALAELLAHYNGKPESNPDNGDMDLESDDWDIINKGSDNELDQEEMPSQWLEEGHDVDMGLANEEQDCRNEHKDSASDSELSADSEADGADWEAAADAEEGEVDAKSPEKHGAEDDSIPRAPRRKRYHNSQSWTWLEPYIVIVCTPTNNAQTIRGSVCKNSI